MAADVQGCRHRPGRKPTAVWSTPGISANPSNRLYRVLILRRNGGEIALHRRVERGLPAGCDRAIPPGAVDAIERQRRDDLCGTPDRGGIERNVVWIAVHEADEAAIHGYGRDVTDQQRALSLGSGAPMQDGPAGKMAADAEQANVCVRPGAAEIRRCNRSAAVWGTPAMAPTHPGRQQVTLNGLRTAVVK